MKSFKEHMGVEDPAGDIQIDESRDHANVQKAINQIEKELLKVEHMILRVVRDVEKSPVIMPISLKDLTANALDELRRQLVTARLDVAAQTK